MRGPRNPLRLALRFFLLLIGKASAATFVVNALSSETEPSPGDGVCETLSGVCTLAAALQEAEAGGAFVAYVRVHYRRTMNTGVC